MWWRPLRRHLELLQHSSVLRALTEVVLAHMGNGRASDPGEDERKPNFPGPRGGSGPYVTVKVNQHHSKDNRFSSNSRERQILSTGAAQASPVGSRGLSFPFPG